MSYLTDTGRIEEIARRYSVRQGFRLVHYREVGLPHYKLRLRAVVMQEKPVPPIAEFVLRSLDAGLRTEEDLSGFLGLEASVVRATLVDLRRAEEIDLIAPPGSVHQQLSLTEKGRRTFEAAQRLSPEEVSVPVYYDGLLRRVVQTPPDDLIEPKELKAQDRVEIRPIPARSPYLEELSVQEVNQSMNAFAKRRPGMPRRELLVIKAVLKGNLLYRPAVMLVYQSREADAVQVAFVVEGILSQEHEAAFAAADGPRLLGIAQNVSRPSARDIAGDLLREIPEANLGDLDAAEAMAEEAAIAQAELIEVRTVLTTVESEEERTAAEERLERAEAKVAHLQRITERLGVRLVPMLEHRELLERALEESKERLLINSPWINSRAVNTHFLKRLSQRLHEGLKVFIAYGLESESKNRSDDRAAEDALKNLARSYKNLRLTKLGDTHAKILISDSRFMVITSFNWLSFRGDHRRMFRDERGVMVMHPEIVNQQFDLIIARMEEAEAGRGRQQAVR